MLPVIRVLHSRHLQGFDPDSFMIDNVSNTQAYRQLGNSVVMPAVRDTAEEIVKLRERYNQIVSDETGKDVDEITKDADRDFWLSPGQALEYGLVGKVVTSITELG